MSTSLLLGFDCPLTSQPEQVGRFVSQAVLPTLEAVARRPGILYLAFCPAILEWCEKTKPPFIEELRSLARRERVLLLRGLYYSPAWQVTRVSDVEYEAQLYSSLWERHEMPLGPIFQLNYFSWSERARGYLSHRSDLTLAVDEALLNSPGYLGEAPVIAVSRGLAARHRAIIIGAENPLQGVRLIVDEVHPLDPVELPTGGTALLREPREEAPLDRDDSVARIEELTNDAERARKKPSRTPDALQDAHRFIARARHRDRLPQAGDSVRRRQEFFESVTRAQVELDSLLHPDVDPNIGWVIWEGDEHHLSFIDTQLMRLAFDVFGGIVRFEYKPRKINLIADVDRVTSFVLGTCRNPQSSEELIHRNLPAPMPAAPVVMRQTPGLFSVRFRKPPLTQELTVKAGIGAHLNNATTGFSFEYWCESSASDFVSLECHLLLPSADRDAVELTPLSGGGGVTGSPLPRSDGVFLRNADVTGGLHGIRLVDRQERFLLDLRSAKPLDRFGAVARVSESGEYAGLSLYFLTEARRIVGDEHSNTMFLSIE